MSTALATYMHRQGISDADLAGLTGRDRSMINKIKRGMLKPTLELAGRIEAATHGEVPMQSWVDASPAGGSDVETPQTASPTTKAQEAA